MAAESHQQLPNAAAAASSINREEKLVTETIKITKMSHEDEEKLLHADLFRGLRSVNQSLDVQRCVISYLQPMQRRRCQLLPVCVWPVVIVAIFGVGSFVEHCRSFCVSPMRVPTISLTEITQLDDQIQEGYTSRKWLGWGVV